LISWVTADNYFMAVGATREDERVPTLTGACMGALRASALDA
jgi:hypothetical protein